MPHSHQSTSHSVLSAKSEVGTAQKVLCASHPSRLDLQLRALLSFRMSVQKSSLSGWATSSQMQCHLIPSPGFPGSVTQANTGKSPPLTSRPSLSPLYLANLHIANTATSPPPTTQSWPRLASSLPWITRSPCFHSATLRPSSTWHPVIFLCPSPAKNLTCLPRVHLRNQ